MDISKEEHDELLDIKIRLRAALNELFSPDLFNYATFGNEAKHVHEHIIPRYNTSRVFNDTEFIDERRGHNCAPYDRSFTVSDETLIKMRDALRCALAT